MATYTTNLNLTKPDYTDAADVAVINTNMDTIDTAVTAKVPKAGGTMTGDLTYTNLIGANNGVSTSSKVDATNFRALYNSTLKARLFAESGGGLLYLYSQNNRLGYISRTSDDLMSFTVFDSDGNARTMSLDAANNKVLANDFTIPSVTSLRTLNDNMGTLREVPFAVAVSDWSGSGTFTANFTTAYVTSTSKEIVMFDSSLRTYGTADINTAKKSGGGGITFTTSKKPTGTITGTIFVFAAQDGKVPYIIENTVTPIANGGTGQSSLAGAQSALGITALSNQIGTLNTNILAMNKVTNSRFAFVKGTAAATSYSENTIKSVQFSYTNPFPNKPSKLVAIANDTGLYCVIAAVVGHTTNAIETRLMSFETASNFTMEYIFLAME